MSRHAHYLSRTYGESLPGQVVCIGIDTRKHDDISAIAFGESFVPMVCTVDAIGYARWRYENGKRCRELMDVATNVDDFWRWLLGQLRPGSCTWMFLHDAYADMTALGLWAKIDDGTFDLYGIDPQSGDKPGKRNSRQWRGCVVAENPPTIIVLRRPNSKATLKILDIRNYGFKREMPGSAVDQCEIVSCFVASWINMLATHKLGSLQHTAGSQAMYSYRHKFMPKRTILVHNDDDALAMERSGYYSGRCEAFIVGAPQCPIVHLDVSSMYLSIGANHSFPVRLDRKVEEEICEGMVKDFCWYRCVADVVIHTREPAYPYRMRCTRCLDRMLKAGKEWIFPPCNRCRVVWPVGKFRTVLCGPELGLALGSGQVVEIKRAYSYFLAGCLREWCEWAWDERQRIREEGFGEDDDCIKALGISLFGKFGQRSRRWEPVENYPDAAKWDSWFQLDTDTLLPQRYRSIGGMVEKQCTEGEHSQSVPAISAWTTSLGRVRLWELMRIAGLANVMYCDTDSLWTTVQGYENLLAAQEIQPGRLGKLRELGRYDDCEFYGIKHYRAGGRLVMAGLPIDTSRVSGQTITREEIERLESCLESKRHPTARIRLLHEKYSRKYLHGRVADDGVVWPLTVNYK